MTKFSDIKPLLNEAQKETLMEIGFNYYQSIKKNATPKGVETHE